MVDLNIPQDKAEREKQRLLVDGASDRTASLRKMGSESSEDGKNAESTDSQFQITSIEIEYIVDQAPPEKIKTKYPDRVEKFTSNKDKTVESLTDNIIKEEYVSKDNVPFSKGSVTIRYKTSRPILLPSVESLVLPIVHDIDVTNKFKSMVLGDRLGEFQASNPWSGPILTNAVTFDFVNIEYGFEGVFISSMIGSHYFANTEDQELYDSIDETPVQFVGDGSVKSSELVGDNVSIEVTKFNTNYSAITTEERKQQLRNDD